MAWIKSKARINRETGKTEPYWMIEWREDGRERTKGLGFVGKKEAERLLKLFEGRAAAGRPVEPEPPRSAPSSPVPTIPTLREYLFDKYLPVVARDRAKKTHETASRSANRLVEVLGDVALDELTYALVDEYVTKRKRVGRRSRTIILELITLRRALEHAVKSGVVEQAPELPRLQDRDRRAHKFLTPEDSVALLDALHPDRVQPHEVTRGRPPEPRDRLSYLAILMALNTGMRRGEILSRTWSDLRWTLGPHGVLIVCERPEIGFKVKAKSERGIPLTPDLREALRDAHVRAGEPSTGWIFPSPTDPSTPRADFTKALRQACKRAGLVPIHPHGLRHTWASRLAVSGVDRKSLMELGGWATGEMLDEVYAHVTSAHTAEVMSRMGIAGSPHLGRSTDPTSRCGVRVGRER